MNFDISWIYQIIDRYSGPLRKINSVTKNARVIIKKMNTSVAAMGDKLANLKNGFIAAGGVAAAAFPISRAMDFEEIMVDVQRVTDFESPEQFEKFRKDIFEMGIEFARLPGIIGRIAVKAGELNIKPKGMKEFITLVVKTSTAFNMLDETASQAIGEIKTKFKLTVPEVEKMMDTINFLGDTSSAVGRDITNIVKRASGEFKHFKIPPDIAVAWSGFAREIETTPELAATAIEQFLVRIKQIPKDLEFEIGLKKDPSKALETYLKGLSKLTDENLAVQMKLLGIEASNFAKKAMFNMGLLEKSFKKIKRGEQVGSMLKEFEKKLKTARSAIDSVKSAADQTFITIGDLFLPAIKKLKDPLIEIIKKVTKFVELNPKLVQTALEFTAIGAAIIAIGIAVGLLLGALSFLFSPVTLTIGAILAAGFGMVKLYENSEDVRKSVNEISKAAENLWKVLTEDGDGEGWNPFGDFVLLAENAAEGALISIGWLAKQIMEVISGTITAALELVTESIIKYKKLFSDIKKSLKGKIDFIDTDQIKKSIESFIGVKLELPEITIGTPDFINSLIGAFSKNEEGAFINNFKQGNEEGAFINNFKQGNGEIASANNLILNAKIDGEIRVISTSRDVEITKTKINVSVPGNLGLNMGT